LADDKFKIFCGTANPELAKAICDYVGVPLGKLSTAGSATAKRATRFSRMCGARMFSWCSPAAIRLISNLMQLFADD